MYSECILRDSVVFSVISEKGGGCFLIFVLELEGCMILCFMYILILVSWLIMVDYMLVLDGKYVIVLSNSNKMI